MATGIETTRLFKWLKSMDNSLAARVLAVRAEVAKWLPQIVQFLPHYPSHGLDHSDRIIEQLSRLLFNERRLVVQFSPPEVYCLLCVAYLHDIGMVVSPGDAGDILASEAWKAFVVGDDKIRDRYDKYLVLRDDPVAENKDLTTFLADQVLRQFVAEFVRRGHHERGKATLQLHPFLRQLVDDGDSVAFATISDLGVAHGLQTAEIADDERFPVERDVFGEKVNVRFLARLLRIGDLLDMSSKRADPMAAQAVGPLPRDSSPHWQQYSTKKHENVSPAVIEFTFECNDQETHRVLRDWFSCLEAEVRAAGLEQMHATRHGGWKAPPCSVSSHPTADAKHSTARKSTIVIRPSSSAEYTFHDWKLELDHEQVLQRLIHNVYGFPFVFVRELIQNALDATRCQMYSDFEQLHPSAAAPERPTQFPPEFREQYPVSISLAYEDVPLSPDGPCERRPVITVEDRGTGMNEEIIRRYFLQVGRSYYQSDEFRKRFKFAPTSRFGVGFLSVFAVSNDVTVDTAHRDDKTGDIVGICLRLREPRNYILTEPWPAFEDRPSGQRTGTRIRVVIDNLPKDERLVDLIEGWCVAVEVPVVVREDEKNCIIRHDRLVDKTVLASARANPRGRFVLRTFDIDSGGVEGQIAVVAYEDDAGEGWCDCWPDERGLGGGRIDVMPKVVDGYTSLHGMAAGGGAIRTHLDLSHHRRNWIQCCDVRSAYVSISMSRLRTDRSDRRSSPTALAALAVARTAQTAVERHLAESQRARGPEGIRYVGEVVSCAPLLQEWRRKCPGTVVTWQNGIPVAVSAEELMALGEVMVAFWDGPPYGERPPTRRHPRDFSSVAPVISSADVPKFAVDWFQTKVQGMNLIGMEHRDDLQVLHFSTTQRRPDFWRVDDDSSTWVAPASLMGAGQGTFYLAWDRSLPIYVLDARHPVVQWLCLLREKSRKYPTFGKEIEGIWRVGACGYYWDMERLLEKWAKDPAVPPELRPPKDGNGEVIRFLRYEASGRPTIGYVSGQSN